MAGTGFLHKMLRKKNITLNGKKAEGHEKLTAGDQIALYFAQETLHKFMGHQPLEAAETSAASKISATGEYLAAYKAYPGIKIIYENTHILLADKPVGILTQKAAPSDRSLNEWLIGYLLTQGEITEAELAACRPSVCNRLDRNTSGIVLCAKSVQGAQLFSSLLQNRTLHKYYQLYVKGTLQDSQLIEGYLTKDSRHNRVSIQPHSRANDSSLTKESYIRTHYRPLKAETDKTLVEVELLTGKPHQIRAHLAGIGHPLLGDYKYGDKNWNDYYKKTCQIRSQLLHACRVTFPELGPPFDDISGRTFQSGLPETFDRVSAQAARI
jgi:23S rRNA pseudouridine955/2504/2580 synthase